MCIICNVGSEIGDEVMWSHVKASKHIEDTRKAFMLASEYAKKLGDVNIARRYKRMAYKCARMRREWNRIEQERETLQV